MTENMARLEGFDALKGLHHLIRKYATLDNSALHRSSPDPRLFNLANELAYQLQHDLRQIRQAKKDISRHFGEHANLKKLLKISSDMHDWLIYFEGLHIRDLDAEVRTDLQDEVKTLMKKLTGKKGWGQKAGIREQSHDLLRNHLEGLVLYLRLIENPEEWLNSWNQHLPQGSRFRLEEASELRQHLPDILALLREGLNAESRESALRRELDIRLDLSGVGGERLVDASFDSEIFALAQVALDALIEGIDPWKAYAAVEALRHDMPDNYVPWVNTLGTAAFENLSDPDDSMPALALVDSWSFEVPDGLAEKIELDRRSADLRAALERLEAKSSAPQSTSTLPPEVKVQTVSQLKPKSKSQLREEVERETQDRPIEVDPPAEAEQDSPQVPAEKTTAPTSHQEKEEARAEVAEPEEDAPLVVGEGPCGSLPPSDNPEWKRLAIEGGMFYLLEGESRGRAVTRGFGVALMSRCGDSEIPLFYVIGEHDAPRLTLHDIEFAVVSPNAPLGKALLNCSEGDQLAWVLNTRPDTIRYFEVAELTNVSVW